MRESSGPEWELLGPLQCFLAQGDTSPHWKCSGQGELGWKCSGQGELGPKLGQEAEQSSQQELKDLEA